MSKKQSPDPKAEQVQSLAAVSTPTAGEAALTSEATGLTDWIKKGDYRTRPKNLFFNYSDPAARDRQRRVQMNTGAQGAAGLAAPNANLLALNKQHLDDEWARDTAGQYESDVSQAGIRASGMLGDVAQLENSREQGRLGATTSMWTNNNSRPRWWEILLSQAGQGAQAAATMGAAGSDMRAKDDIQAIESPLEKIEQIHGYTYRWNELGAEQFAKNEGSADVGVLAQEVEQVFPELVLTNSDGYKMVNYNGLVGLLFSAVNELSAKVKELEDRK